MARSSVTPEGRSSGGSRQITGGGGFFWTVGLPYGSSSAPSSGGSISRVSRRPSAATRSGTSPSLVTTNFHGPATSGASILSAARGGGKVMGSLPTFGSPNKKNRSTDF